MLAVVAAAGDSPSTLAAVPQPFMAADAQHEAAGRLVCLLALFFSGGRSTAGLRSKKPVGCGVIRSSSREGGEQEVVRWLADAELQQV